MGDSRVFLANNGAGSIKRIRLENFMCHSDLEIELCPWLNFITGQNGSGKSAILTALCVAFGHRPKGATALRDLIRTGCSYAVVEVEVRNQGRGAFKQEIYGEEIIIQRTINQSASSIILMGFQGRKIASQIGELQELIKHFNIDVENPFVITSQGKSREFLHSGNGQENFKAREEALTLPRNEFLRDSSILKRQLNWNFNHLLRTKGISGSIQVNYEAETLGVMVNLPQDALNRAIRDSRELSDGERSFVALCFALVVQEITESPFRAMDGLDVSMDADSSKMQIAAILSIVDFAINQGSQWILITPHDISMVKEGERIKKLQMAAPRS